MRTLRLIVGLSVCALALYAQNASVSGRVTDASDAAIAGAKVDLTNKGTSIVVSTTTNAEGFYVLPSQPPGQYDIAAAAPGFSARKVEAITLEVGQARTVNFQLAVGQLQESITVVDEAPLLSMNRSDRGTVVENAFVKSIPLNTRNPLLLLTLTPGITGTSSSGSNATTQSLTNNWQINGGRRTTNEVLIDGASNTTSYNNQVSAIPQVDAVQEFKVYTSPYNAEFGRTGGGVISFAIKSGTNTPHGTLHEFLRNAVLDSNGFNANRAGQEKQSFKRNQFGFTLGGPVYIPKIYNGSSRTFFFVAYEGLRERSAARFTGTVPTELERRGDFSQTFDASGKLWRIFDPRTVRRDPANPSRYIRDPFPNNIITGALSPIALNVMKYYPAPNQAGRGLSNQDNFFTQGPKKLDQDRIDLRIDHQLSSRHTVFARYNWFENNNADPSYYGNIASPVQTATRIPGINWVGNHTWTMSASTILEQQFSLSQTESNRIPETMGFDYTTLGFSKRFTEGQRLLYFPTISLGPLSGVGPTGSGYNESRGRSWQYKLNLTFLRGRHTIRAGVDYRRLPVRFNTGKSASIGSAQGMTGGPDPNSTSSNTGHGLATMMLGLGTASYDYTADQHQLHHYYGAYIQDEIRLTPKLTITPGLRYSIETPLTEENNQMIYLDLGSPSPLAGQVPGFPNLVGGIGFVGANGIGRRTQITDINNFDPRLGLAYQLNDKTVIHSGAGFFRHPGVVYTDSSYGFERSTSSLATEADGVTPIFNLADPFPQGVLMPTGNSLGLMTNVGRSIDGPMRQQQLPYQIQWSFDVQRQLPASFVVELGYTGSSGVGLPSGYAASSSGGQGLNQLPMEALALGDKLLETVPNPFYGLITDAGSSLSRPTIQRQYLLRPYPQFGNITANQTALGHSVYHAFQAKVERRFSQGLALLFAYTHSKLIDNVGELGNFLGRNSAINNAYCFACDRSLSVMDLSDVVRLSSRYELPMGVGKPYLNKGLLARVIGGWAIAGFLTFDNGFPVMVTSPNDSYSFGGAGMRPMATGQKAALPGGPDMVDGGQYFNAAAFSRTPRYAFGNVSRTLPDVRDPGNINLDALIEKRISVNERTALDFRLEMFNATNRVQMAGPGVAINTPADFGIIRFRQVNTPRQIQFGMRLSF